MLKLRNILLIGASLLFLATIVYANEGISGKVVNAAEPSIVLSAKYQTMLNEVSGNINKGKIAEVTATLNKIDYYLTRQMTNKKVQYLSFADAEEYQAFLNEFTPSQTVVWCDKGWEKELYYREYLLSDAKLFDQALVKINAALLVAPYASELYCEKGYCLANLKKTNDALAAYNQAIDLADRFASEAHNKAWALRGRGYQLSDLGQIEEAKAAYNESLGLDPNNKTALDELDYIKGLQAPAPASGNEEQNK